MAIIGLTRDKEGQPIVRQAVTHKLVIGRGPNTKHNETKAPRKLDYIAFMKKDSTGAWVDDMELTEHYRKQCEGKPNALKIVLFENEIDTVFPHEMKAFVTRGVWCHGDGVKAERRGKNPPARDDKEWPDFAPFQGPCAEGGCPFVGNKCKPMGTLYFSMVDFLKLGSLCKVQTTSYQSIMQIHGALQTLKHMTGGVIRGIPMKLFIQPDQAKFMQGNELRTGWKFVWGLEVAASDMSDMSRQLTEGPREMYRLRQLSMGTIIEAEEENEEDLAEEVTDEFYDNESSAKPDEQPQKTKGGSAAGASASGSSNGKAAHPMKDTLEELDLEERADELMTQLGLGNKAQRQAKIAEYRGKIKELIEQLEQRAAAAKKGAAQTAEEKPEPPAADAPKKSAKDRVKEANAARQAERASERQTTEREAAQPKPPAENRQRSVNQRPQGGFEW